MATHSQITPTPLRRPAAGHARPTTGGVTVARLALAVALSVLSPFCLVWSLPPAGAWPLVFIALVPMLVAQHRLLPVPLAGLAPAITVGLLVVLLSADVLAPVPAEFYGVAVFLAVVEVGLGGMDRYLQRASGYRWFVIAAPLVIVGADVAQGSSAIASTWAYPAYALFDHRTFVAPVGIFTTDGLDLLILATNYAVAQFLIPGVRVRRAAWWCLGIAITWAGWLLYGQALASRQPTGRAVRVAAVQAAPGPPAQTSGVLSRLTHRAAADGAQLVVWHEDVLFPRVVQGLPSLAALPSLAFAGRTAKVDHLYLVAGLAGAAGSQAVAFSPSGQLLGTYVKQHPVTFLGEHSSPTQVPVYHTSLAPLSTIICYDLDFLDTARDAGTRGAEIVAVPSGDWARVAPLHYTHLVFRAVENDLAMVKADDGFDSAIIDPQGRILAHTSSSRSRPALLVSTVRLGTGKTVAQSIEPWLAPASLALGMLLYAGMLIRAGGSRRRGR